MGDLEKGRSPKKRKSLMDVPSVEHLKVQVLGFNMNLGESLGVQENCRSRKKLKSLIEVPYVAHLNIQVPSFKLILISAP